MVLGANPPNVGEICQLPPSMLYSQSVMGFSVIPVGVLLLQVGVSGAVCEAFATVTEFEVTLPVQFVTVTITVMAAPMSVCTKV